MVIHIRMMGEDKIKVFITQKLHLGVSGQSSGHECNGVGALLQDDLVLAVLHLVHLLDQQPVGHVVEDAVGGKKDDVAIFHRERILVRSIRTVC